MTTLQTAPQQDLEKDPLKPMKDYIVQLDAQIKGKQEQAKAAGKRSGKFLMAAGIVGFATLAVCVLLLTVGVGAPLAAEIVLKGGLLFVEIPLALGSLASLVRGERAKEQAEKMQQQRDEKVALVSTLETIAACKPVQNDAALAGAFNCSAALDALVKYATLKDAAPVVATGAKPAL